MSTPCISVVVPVYNSEKYIHKCIDSILNQSFSDIELILVDDGSEDNCGAICDEYAKKDSRVRVFHQQNRGACCARNVGIDNAKGEFISFVDSDDGIAKNALEILHKDITTFNADISCAGGGKHYSDTKEAFEKSKYMIWTGSDAIKKSLLGNGHTHSACRKLYKRSFVGDTRFDEGGKIHEDGFFVFCCFLKEPVVVLRNVNIYYYRHNPDSISNAGFSERFLDVLYFADKKRDLVNDLYPEFEAETNSMIVRANLVMLNLFCRTNDKKYKKDIKRCINTVKRLKKFFVPVMPIDKKLLFVVTNNLYGVFRVYHKIKYKHK